MSCSGDYFPKFLPDIKNCVFTACYCEENIWKLCEYIHKNHPLELEHCYATFISNNNRKIPIWHQRASKREDRLVIWDYHVILLYHYNGKTWVYDLDTELPAPCPLDQYMTVAIRNDDILAQSFRRYFRVVPAVDYLASFASDRSHMLTENGTWLAEPPPYPCICTPESKNNLQEFISMKRYHGLGSVYTVTELTQRFSSS